MSEPIVIFLYARKVFFHKQSKAVRGACLRRAILFQLRNELQASGREDNRFCLDTPENTKLYGFEKEVHNLGFI